MKLSPRLTLLTATALMSGGAIAASPLAVTVKDIADAKPIPARYALCKPTEDGKSTNGRNKRPEIAWSGAPKETKSYAVIMHDTDVPKDFTNAGKEGTVIKANAPRQDFYHWGVVDIPATTTKIFSGSRPVRVGVSVKNDLGAYMPNPKNYGGPCPPWNDERTHHYHFTVYALDVESLGLAADATAKDAANALQKNKHVLARGEAVGTYTLNATLLKQ